MKTAVGMLCLMSRVDHDQLSEEKRVNIIPFYDAFQDSVTSVRLISDEDGTKIEIMAQNVLVEEVNKLLWYGIHDLVSPGNVSYIELHNFDAEGNTIDIEKYIVDSILMSIVKHQDCTGPQSIQITGAIREEITISDPV